MYERIWQVLRVLNDSGRSWKLFKNKNERWKKEQGWRGSTSHAEKYERKMKYDAHDKKQSYVELTWKDVCLKSFTDRLVQEPIYMKFTSSLGERMFGDRKFWKISKCEAKNKRTMVCVISWPSQILIELSFQQGFYVTFGKLLIKWRHCIKSKFVRLELLIIRKFQQCEIPRKTSTLFIHKIYRAKWITITLLWIRKSDT